jgi:hypothetical protein
MAPVTRLVTLVEVEDDVADARQLSVSARHEAELADGRRLLLLGDRGWTSSAVRTVPDGGSVPAHVPDTWAEISVEEIESTARTVVGPDEPFGGRSQEDMEADHWAYLAGILAQQGVMVDAVELKRLPHDVVLGPRLLQRVAGGQGGAV